MEKTLNNQFKSALEASRTLVNLDQNKINTILMDLADKALEKSSIILNENAKDLARMDENDPKYDRLKLTEERIEGIANDMRNVASLANPVGTSISSKTLDNGLEINKVRVPIGVIGIIYEARPNVSFDVFSLCFKTANACILKGGSDAADSNKIIVSIIQEVLINHGINPNIVTLLPPDRSATAAMLEATEYVDIIIPRGSQNLINFVRENAKVPVIETGAGIVHTYVDASADIEKAKNIVTNAKTRRVSVCNALDCMLIDHTIVDKAPHLVRDLAEKQTKIFADSEVFEQIKSVYPQELLFMAETSHYGTEFLSNQLAIKSVNGVQEAIEHITKYSSKHSEAIVAENESVLSEFLNRVDAAAVYANTSTAFTDGAQFGLGAEIGISTQKLHARGPMALEELTTYKWIVRGNGQIRN